MLNLWYHDYQTISILLSTRVNADYELFEASLMYSNNLALILHKTSKKQVNRPFSGAASGENLLLRWTSYQTSHSEKHSFYETLVGKLLQRG